MYTERIAYRAVFNYIFFTGALFTVFRKQKTLHIVSSTYRKLGYS